MNKDKRLLNLISFGFDTDLAKKAVDKNYTYSKLSQATKADLKDDFHDYEVNEIIDLTKRKPIPEDVIEQLIKECDWKCCVCWDITDFRKFEHSASQESLVVKSPPAPSRKTLGISRSTASRIVDPHLITR